MAKYRLAGAVLDFIDQCRADALAPIYEHRVGRRHPHQRRLAGSERHRQQRWQVVDDAKAFRVLDDRVHSDILRQADSHQVARFFNTEAQRARTIKLVRIVRGPPAPEPRPLVYDEGGIQNLTGRRETFVEGGQVNKGLEGRARLPPRLGHPVEFTDLRRKPAGHCQHAAGMRIEGHNPATDLRHLAQPVSIRRPVLILVLAGHCLDRDDVARREHV